MKTYEEQYLDLMQEVLLKGDKRSNRTGTDTYSLFAKSLSFPVRANAFPILTTKRVAFGSMVTELLWFLRGYTDTSYLRYYKCSIWDEWATPEAAEARGMAPGELGPVYGQQWRHFGGYRRPDTAPVKDTIYYQEHLAAPWVPANTIAHLEAQVRPLITQAGPDGVCRRWEDPLTLIHDLTLLSGYPQWHRNRTNFVLKQVKPGLLCPETTWWVPADSENTERPVDQIADIMHLLRNDPDSRRMVVSAWNPEDSATMALTPCHSHWQVYVNSNYEVDMVLYQRSADIFLGVPFNMASYSLLLLLLAKSAGLKPGNLTMHFGDVHLYTNHIQQAITQIRRDPYEAPAVEVPAMSYAPGLCWGYNLHPSDFRLRGYRHGDPIPAPVAV